MRITDLKIHHVRNISSAHLQFHPQCNVFFGANGSGKTSLLEAIYLLSSGHSFRTREISPLISHGQDTLTVFARTTTDESVSIQKSLSGPTQVKLNRQACYSSSELAHFLPCQIFYQDIFQILDAGPSVRRTLLDWGLFHVEPTYHTLWKQYRLVLKQRNALLRQKANATHFIPWDAQLAELGEQIHAMRLIYFNQWMSIFQQIFPALSDIPCALTYYKGWDKKAAGKSLAEALAEHFIQDQQRQYTHSGVHQADIILDVSSKRAKLLLSRGEQKITLIALKLAQASLLSQECIYLVDDLAAELDTEHLKRLMTFLAGTKGQFFFTAMDDATMACMNKAMALKLHPLNKSSFQHVA